jgi:hypothetical protein
MWIETRLEADQRDASALPFVCVPTCTRARPSPTKASCSRSGARAAAMLVGHGHDAAADQHARMRKPDTPLEALINEAPRHCRSSACPRGHEPGRRQRMRRAREASILVTATTLPPLHAPTGNRRAARVADQRGPSALPLVRVPTWARIRYSLAKRRAREVTLASPSRRLAAHRASSQRRLEAGSCASRAWPRRRRRAGR